MEEEIDDSQAVQNCQETLTSVWHALGTFVENVLDVKCKEEVLRILSGGQISILEIAKLSSHLQVFVTALQEIRKMMQFSEKRGNNDYDAQNQIEPSLTLENCDMNRSSKHGKDSLPTTNVTSVCGSDGEPEFVIAGDFQSATYFTNNSCPAVNEQVVLKAAGSDTQKGADDHRSVQIRASKAEIEQRICAFINHKKSDLDELNVREFCYGLPDSGAGSSCARVDAVFVPRAGSTSHLKVTRVLNTQGPQTRLTDASQDRVRLLERNTSRCQDLGESIEERLHNAEQHLNLNKDSKMDIFRRLKAIEERILFLEGISLEYFQDGIPPPKHKKHTSSSSIPSPPNPTDSFVQLKKSYNSLSEIDQRIQELRSVLQQQAKDV